MTLTEKLARTALELHRAALAAAEAKDLQSPATPVEKNSKGASDPTASAAMDDRRKAVAEALRDVEKAAQAFIDDIHANALNPLKSALADWEGKK